jgi:hypothetical protein
MVGEPTEGSRVRNPHFGRHGWPAAHGDTAKRAARRVVRSHAVEPRRSVNHCPMCGRGVRWDTDRQGAAVALEGSRVHVCDTSEVLAHVQHEDGAEVLAILRRAINERRMYGEAV